MKLREKKSWYVSCWINSFQCFFYLGALQYCRIFALSTDLVPSEVDCDKTRSICIETKKKQNLNNARAMDS